MGKQISAVQALESKNTFYYKLSFDEMRDNYNYNLE